MDSSGASLADPMVYCRDFSAFQGILNARRQIDDRITYMLNNSIPTASFAAEKNAIDQCKGIYEQILLSYTERDGAIKACVEISRDSVSKLQAQKAQKPDDFDILKRLRSEQTKLRLMQSELNVEEVLKDRIMKVFNDRCRYFQKPTNP